MNLLGLALAAGAVLTPAASPGPESTPGFRQAAQNGVQVEEVFRRTHRMVQAWLRYADRRTLLLPDTLPGARRGNRTLDLYTPHNSGADNYPYLVATAFLTDRELYEGRMREMLRSEIRYTNVQDGIPGNLDLKTGTLGPASLFGAAEYAKDGLLAITELLGRTPWFYRMADMTAAVMEHAPVKSDFGPLPDAGAELNGDMLQALVRLATMTGDRRFLEWAERIGDAYVREVLPRNHGLPGYTWDFEKHEGPDRMRLRDHGNETVVGLALLHALEEYQHGARGPSYRTAIGGMLDRILASANPDGLLYDAIRASDLQPLETRLSDNWGYVYGAVYTYYMVTGDDRYREAVRKVLRSLPRYRNHDWENGSQDGYADSIESALYLMNREPVPEAAAWSRARCGRSSPFSNPTGSSRAGTATATGRAPCCSTPCGRRRAASWKDGERASGWARFGTATGCSSPSTPLPAGEESCGSTTSATADCSTSIATTCGSTNGRSGSRWTRTRSIA